MSVDSGRMFYVVVEACGNSFIASSFSVKQEVHLLPVGSREEDRDLRGKRIRRGNGLMNCTWKY